MSGFAATAEMAALQLKVDEAFAGLSAALKGVYPVLDDQSLSTLTPTIKNLLYQRGDSFESQYDRLAGFGQSGFTTWITRFGDDMVTVGVALILVALLVFFGRPLLKSLGLPRLTISVFFLMMCVLAVVYDLSLTVLLSNAVVRMAMNSILVLAMLPGIQCGISLNLGLPLGIIGGLLGGLMCIEFGFHGLWGFLFAIASGCSIAAVVGFGYGHLLNRLKGNVDRVRVTAIVFSTVLASLGHLIYAQHMGTLQTYGAHEQVGLYAGAAILVGGASIAKATNGQALLGCILFHLLFIVAPGAGKNVFGDAAIAEFFRVFISYGVIALALVMHAWSAVAKKKDPEKQMEAAAPKTA